MKLVSCFLNCLIVAAFFSVSVFTHAKNDEHEHFEKLNSSMPPAAFEPAMMALTNIYAGISSSESYFEKLIEYIHVFYGVDVVLRLAPDMGSDELFNEGTDFYQLASSVDFRRNFYKNWLSFLDSKIVSTAMFSDHEETMDVALHNFWGLPVEKRTRTISFRHEFGTGAPREMFLHMFRFIASFVPDYPLKLITNPQKHKVRPVKLLLRLQHNDLVPSHVNENQPVDTGHSTELSDYIRTAYDDGLIQGVDFEWSSELAQIATKRSNYGPSGQLAKSLSRIVQSSALRSHPERYARQSDFENRSLVRDFEMRVRFLDGVVQGVMTRDSLGLDVLSESIDQEWRFTPPFENSGRWLNLVLQGEIPYRNEGFRDLVENVSRLEENVLMKRTVTLRPNTRTIDAIQSEPSYVIDPVLFNLDSIRAGHLSVQIEGDEHRLHLKKSAWKRFLTQLAVDTLPDRGLFEQVGFEYWKQHANQERSGSLFSVSGSAQRFIDDRSETKQSFRFLHENAFLAQSFSNPKEWKVWKNMLALKDPPKKHPFFREKIRDVCKLLFTNWR